MDFIKDMIKLLLILLARKVGWLVLNFVGVMAVIALVGKIAIRMKEAHERESNKSKKEPEVDGREDAFVTLDGEGSEV